MKTENNLKTDEARASRRYGEVAHVRFSASEMVHLRSVADAGNLTVSEVVRRLVRESAGELPAASEAIRPEIESMTEQLRKIGVNLNQAVRAMNEGRVNYDEDLERALIALGEMVRRHRGELRFMLVKPAKARGRSA